MDGLSIQRRGGEREEGGWGGGGGRGKLGGEGEGGSKEGMGGIRREEGIFEFSPTILLLLLSQSF